MNDVVALGLILLLATSGYAAGRAHGQFGYRRGYRYGYRQGYFDGDRASWNRRRRDLQAAVASVLNSVPDATQRRAEAGVGSAGGSVYTSRARSGDEPEQADETEPVEGTETDDAPARGVVPLGRHARLERETARPLAEVTTE